MATSGRVPAAVVKKRLAAILKGSELENTSERKIRTQLEKELGPVDEHKALIRDGIEEFLTTLAESESAEEQDDGDGGSDDDLEDRKRSAGKKRKVTASKAVPSGSKSTKALSGDGSLETGVTLGGSKKLSLNTYKGKLLVDMREYYTKDGVEAPGAKGISLSADQWHTLVEGLPSLLKAMEAEDEDFLLQITTDRRAYVSIFKGRASAHVREMYQKDGEWAPGKKGIALNSDDLATLVRLAESVTARLSGKTAPAPAAAAAAPKAESSGAGEDGDEFFISLGGTKRASISTFMKKTGVDLREFYTKGEECLPGKKGILLSREDWTTLVGATSDITAALKSKDMSYCLKLSGSRKVSLSEFKNVVYVGVREFYEKGGQMLPGAKGLSLNAESWDILVGGMVGITKKLA